MDEEVSYVKQLLELLIKREYCGICVNCELSDVQGYSEHCGYFYGGSCRNEDKVPKVKLISRADVLPLANKLDTIYASYERWDRIVAGSKVDSPERWILGRVGNVLRGVFDEEYRKAHERQHPSMRRTMKEVIKKIHDEQDKQKAKLDRVKQLLKDQLEDEHYIFRSDLDERCKWFSFGRISLLESLKKELEKAVKQ